MENFKTGGESFKDVQDIISFEGSMAKWGLKPDDIDLIIMTICIGITLWARKNAKTPGFWCWKKKGNPLLTFHQIMDFAFAPC